MAARLLTPLDADVEIMRQVVAGNAHLKDLDDRFREHFESTRRLYYREKRKLRRYFLGFIPWIREFVSGNSLLVLTLPLTLGRWCQNPPPPLVHASRKSSLLIQIIVV